jgi:hypothetical protein
LVFFPLFAHVSPPLWYIDQDAEYPISHYIAAMGGGNSRTAAENQAISNLSFYFQTSVEIRNKMLVEYNEIMKNGQTDFSQRVKVIQSAIISSQTEFLGIKFAPGYQDGQGNFFALAYINRGEAIGIYDAKIQFNLALIQDLLDTAEKGNDPLSALGKLKKARGISRIHEEYAKMVSVINPAAGRQYATTVLNTARRIQDITTVYRPRLTAAVVYKAADARIGRKLQEVMQGLGFTMTERNPAYIVTLTVSTAEETTPAILFVRSGVDVKITPVSQSTVVFSYNRSLPRFGHATMEGAYGRAYLNIEKDLDENFTKEFNSVFGN